MYTEPFKFNAKTFADDRGTFSPLELKKEVPDFNLVQINTVFNYADFTFRGMHWQEPPYDQTKIIRCVSGKIVDFVIDIRKGSPNFGRIYAFPLCEKDEWVYAPRGFAHGYVTLPSHKKYIPNIVEYLVDNEYNDEVERGVNFVDTISKALQEEIPNFDGLIIKDRDLHWPALEEIETSFRYDPDEQ